MVNAFLQSFKFQYESASTVLLYVVHSDGRAYTSTEISILMYLLLTQTNWELYDSTVMFILATITLYSHIVVSKITIQSE